MGPAIFQVDAFASEIFSGNPAAVCILNEAPNEAWMQAVAAEMNLSETAFLLARDDGFSLRWFTPLVEVSLCGHATLASSHVLWTEGYVPARQELRFHTASGVLTASASDETIELDFPARPVEEEISAPDGLNEALGVEPVLVGRSRDDLLVLLPDESAVRSVTPDFAKLALVRTRGVIVTAESSQPGVDIVSRFFAPAVGVDEDPVTGSAHCCLGPFWSQRLGTVRISAFQASARGGMVRLRMTGDRVVLGGQAVTVMRGELSGLGCQL